MAPAPPRRDCAPPRPADGSELCITAGPAGAPPPGAAQPRFAPPPAAAAGRRPRRPSPGAAPRTHRARGRPARCRGPRAACRPAPRRLRGPLRICTVPPAAHRESAAPPAPDRREATRASRRTAKGRAEIRTWRRTAADGARIRASTSVRAGAPLQHRPAPPGAGPAQPRYAPPPTQHRYGTTAAPRPPRPGVGPTPQSGFQVSATVMPAPAALTKVAAHRPRPDAPSGCGRRAAGDPPKLHVFGGPATHPPPRPATRDDHSADDFNVSPRYVSSSHLLLLIKPNTSARSSFITRCDRRGEERASVTVDFGMKGPPRCERCGAFVSGFASFGRQWKCHRRTDVGPAGVSRCATSWQKDGPLRAARHASCSVDFLVRGGTIARGRCRNCGCLSVGPSFDDQCLKDIVGDVLDVVPHSKLSKAGRFRDGHAWRKSEKTGQRGLLVVREGFCAVPSHQWLGTRDVFAKTCEAALEAAPTKAALQGVHGSGPRWCAQMVCERRAGEYFW